MKRVSEMLLFGKRIHEIKNTTKLQHIRELRGTKINWDWCLEKVLQVCLPAHTWGQILRPGPGTMS